MSSISGQTPASPPSSGEHGAAISNAIVRIQREFVGRGPTRARTSIRDGVVVVLLYENLTKAERTLAAAGNHDQVLALRHSFQQTMRNEMVAAVEEITGRRVLAFMSDNHIEPDLATEVFVLEPGGRAADDTPG